MNVSVVVPTYRRLDLLKRCLSALSSQSLEPACYEIIVADDGADEQVAAAVGRFQEYHGPRISYVPVRGPHGPAAARNAGWRAATAPIVAFTDDDCIPDRQWLEKGVKRFREDNVVAVSGRVVMPMSKNPTDYERSASHLETAEFVTANCFCRRDALERLDGFDERFTRAWREDSDLHFRLLSCGNVVKASDAIVIHPIRPAAFGVALTQLKNNFFEALLFKKHRALYRERIRPFVPWSYYLMVALVVAAGIAFVYSHGDVAWLMMGAWLFLTARFCRRRLHRTTHRLGHVMEMIVTSVLIPPVAIAYRVAGAIRYRVLFL